MVGELFRFSGDVLLGRIKGIQRHVPGKNKSGQRDSGQIPDDAFLLSATTFVFYSVCGIYTFVAVYERTLNSPEDDMRKINSLM